MKLLINKGNLMKSFKEYIAQTYPYAAMAMQNLHKISINAITAELLADWNDLLAEEFESAYKDYKAGATFATRSLRLAAEALDDIFSPFSERGILCADEYDNPVFCTLLTEKLMTQIEVHPEDWALIEYSIA